MTISCGEHRAAGIRAAAGTVPVAGHPVFRAEGGKGSAFVGRWSNPLQLLEVESG